MKNRMAVANTGKSRLMDTEELRAYTNLGRNSAMKFVTISFACKLVAEKMVRLQNSYQEEQEETK